MNEPAYLHLPQIKVSNKQNELRHLSCVTDLEHTELLTDVGQTLRLLRLVVNHVESHSLGQRSTLNLATEAYLH